MWKWSRKQAKCLFDTAQYGSSLNFQTQVLQIPLLSTDRKQFLDAEVKGSQVPNIHQCFTDPMDWELLHGEY